MNKKKSRKTISITESSTAQYLTFVAATGEASHSIEMRYQDENIWLTQKMMAALYDVTVPAINQHLKRIFEDAELSPDSVVKEYLITAADGKNYRAKHYNLQDRLFESDFDRFVALQAKRTEIELAEGKP